MPEPVADQQSSFLVGPTNVHQAPTLSLKRAPQLGATAVAPLAIEALEQLLEVFGGKERHQGPLGPMWRSPQLHPGEANPMEFVEEEDLLELL